MKALITLFIVAFCTASGLAQDKIFKKDKSVIECKITEVGLDEVKYHEVDMSEGPVMTIAIDELVKIELSNGRIIEFTNPLTDPATYAEDKKSALKINFLSPLLNNLTFSYERSLKPGRSFESELGLIGVGFDTEDFDKTAGVYVSAGYKFLRTPDFYSKRLKYSHILKGSYIKPQLILSVYNVEHDSPSGLYDSDENIVAGALLINIGRQIIYDNFFLMDFSLGMGYGFSNQNNFNGNEYNSSYRVNHYGFISGDEYLPFAIAARVKIGFLIK